ncbi:endonuclease Q family protein [Halobacillus shinanisalinarum]|uniref:Endonuclease Q family protein n=1 Tax=Halobacillus shinanisalinarum TaxID=2932258 RepID=A0ABY4GZZ3_9BACI|nr:endonuclease Q family protein [Halobacillus shinanisalinarum]UOQ93654.1 endonuclease Q family protein [Halobacillus shinanisalinarum]
MSISSYFVDLHVHVGSDWYGKPVKITGSKSLTITAILEQASRRKGLDIVGVIDAHVPAVQEELIYLVEHGGAKELAEGGVRFEDTVLLLGSEIEIYDAASSGPIHVLCYFPTIEKMKAFTEWLAHKMTNINLSSQRFYGTGRELQGYVHEHGGWFIPAHVFTPFKSMYGKGVKTSLREVFDADRIDAVELGLSSDTEMADQIEELHHYPFLTNSDAHSAIRLAREYQLVDLNHASFLEFGKALKQTGGRGVRKNFGMNPKLGKYHRTVCAVCFHPGSPSDRTCKACGSKKMVKGVADRIEELISASLAPQRPDYIYQVPLDYLPGVGHKTYEKILEAFGTEMAIIHEINYQDMIEVVPKNVAAAIVSMREGELEIIEGGGGVYGKIQPKLS